MSVAVANSSYARPQLDKVLKRSAFDATSPASQQNARHLLPPSGYAHSPSRWLDLTVIVGRANHGYQWSRRVVMLCLETSPIAAPSLDPHRVTVFLPAGVPARRLEQHRHLLLRLVLNRCRSL